MDVRNSESGGIILGALINGGPIRYDEAKIDEAVFHQRSLINDPRNKNKSVIFTEEGLHR